MGSSPTLGTQKMDYLVSYSPIPGQEKEYCMGGNQWISEVISKHKDKQFKIRCNVCNRRLAAKIVQETYGSGIIGYKVPFHKQKGYKIKSI